MLDQDSGEYYHVLDGEFIKKEQFRTVYYDGEATFALCRLYSLTSDEKWLNAAKSAVEHFISADYVQYKDHWVAYSMNEITKYVDDERYYTFALRNAQENLDTIYNRDTTYHTYFELLMSTFEIYDRMIERGIHVDYLDNGFDLEYFLRTIYKRADHMLIGCAENDGDEITVAVSLELSALCEKLGHYIAKLAVIGFGINPYIFAHFKSSVR